ncbi:MAG TPA: bifunctional phosphoglucose/phosphomannose isomerase [Fimbriimonadales bacterium]|nr:bifunctional phosphoglucose/phosphomannose isomerase [Fimbriimonadales bacterium]
MPERLNDPGFVVKNDPSGLMGLALGFPDQCRKALSLSEKVEIPSEYKGKSHIVVSGMGGSAAGGDFLRSLMEAESNIPCFVVRDYSIPNFVNKETLFIACSYSGNTEETLSATNEALERNASILAITTGGELRRLANEKGFPVILLPSGLPPRMAFGYLFVPMLYTICALSYLPNAPFEEAFSVLERCRDDWNPEKPLPGNLTKGLAARLFGRLPIIYGLGSWQGVVSNRWKCQINENAKVMAFANAFPELNHNEIVGWTLASRQNVRYWVCVFLESGFESKKMQIRARVTSDLIRDKTELYTVTARGNSLLTQMLTLAYFGDFTSLYLAALYEVDPARIEAIDKLKTALREAH